MIRHSGLAAFLLAVACVASVTSPAAAAERVLLGYYATFGGMPVEDLPWKRLTHVAHAFLRLDAEGKLVRTSAVPNPALTAAGREQRVPVLLSIGGGATVRGLEKATATPAGVQALADEIVAAVRDGGYAGVDLDWEFPRDAKTRVAHAALLAKLREELDAAVEPGSVRPLVTAAVSPSDDLGQWVDAPAVADAVDWLHVMAYDMAGPWSRFAAHHAPLLPSPDDPERDWRSVESAMAYWVGRGVPKEKLVVGAPLYGRAMPADEPHAPLNAADEGRHRALGYSAVRKLAGEGWLAEWDPVSRSAWLRKPPADETASPLSAVADDDGPVLIAYDDLESVRQKAAWARREGYRGMFFWAVHQDRMPDGRHWLLEAAGKAWPADEAAETAP